MNLIFALINIVKDIVEYDLQKVSVVIDWTNAAVKYDFIIYKTQNHARFRMCQINVSRSIIEQGGVIGLKW